jgi:hypothetical protein
VAALLVASVILSIRPELLQTLEADVRERFARRLAAHLRQLFPDDLVRLDEPALLELVHAAIAKASSYGVVIEYDVARFAEYAVFYGRSFDADPMVDWAGEILRDPSISGTEKMERIDTMTREIYRRS